ncbi:ABC transporter ATP-binding protein [Paenibacillus sp. y28]|uniref:ABC transporter ATP-binding protein n=1 Tax=Paenibacillus sp. y28 TaxID=3129110 RepID=UPI00301734F3
MKGIKGLQARLMKLLEIGQLRKPMALLLPYIARYGLLYGILLVLLLVGIGVTLFHSWFLQQMTDAAVSGNLREAGWLLLAGAGVVLVSALALYLNTVLEAKAVHGVKRDLKIDLFHHLLRLPAKYYGRHHSGELTSYMTNDMNNIDGAIGSNLLSMLRMPLMALAAFAYLCWLNWQMALLCIVIGPISLLSGAVFGKLMRRQNREIHDALGKQQSFLHDTFAGYAVIRSFILEKAMYAKYEAHSDHLLSMEMKVSRLRGWFQAGAGSAGTLAYLSSFGLGAYMVMQGSLTLGKLMAFVTLMQYLIYPLTGLAGKWGAFQRSLAAVERIQGVFAEQPEARRLPEGSQVAKLTSGVELRRLSFSYDGVSPVIRDFSLTVRSGQMVALVGPSGAGKSTLFHLLQRFYNPDEGEVLLDGRAAGDMPLAELRSFISYVPQETYLFAGTIRDNIAYGSSGATEEQIVQALKDANAYEFVMALPDGLHTDIGERGLKLSGGQRQRLAIARAVLKNAPVLLLDEATSALDSEAELLVQEALDRLMQGRTTLVIAHRLSTIQHADVIAVLDQGRVVEQGQHQELLDRNGLYTRLYHMQFHSKRTESQGTPQPPDEASLPASAAFRSSRQAMNKTV